MRLSVFRLIPVLLGLIAIVSGWMVGLLLIDGAPGLAEEAATPHGADSGVPETLIDDYRLGFGKIFLGTVVAVTGEDVIETSDPTDDLPVILYAVDVSQSVRGDVNGLVDVWYNGFTDQSVEIAEYGGTGPLQIGAQYLFFAGFDPRENWYPVGDGPGVIPIRDEQEAARLIAVIELRLETAEHEATPIPPPDPCEQAGHTEISVSPAAGRPGDRVVVAGMNLVRPKATIFWDRRGKGHLMVAEVQADCSLRAEIVIPEAKPGEHEVVVLDARGKPAKATFTVEPLPGTPAAQAFDPQRDFKQRQASDEIRVYHGMIFVARVDALEGEELESS